MVHRIIRFGGSNIGNTNSEQNLISSLKSSNGAKLVIVSAIPQLLDWMERNIDSVFYNQLHTETLTEELFRFYQERAVGAPGGRYSTLAQQLASLFKGIALTGDYSAGLKDHLVSYSEKLSAEILLANLHQKGASANVLWPEEINLEATTDFGNATLVNANKAILEQLSEQVLIIPGSYGITSTGKIARTGKTAADYTAAFLTSFLDVQRLELWGLDNHFQKADPKIVTNPPVIDRLTYSEASELAYFDHYSFHPRAVEPLEHKHIPIVVLNTDLEPGTVETIINTETYIDEKIVKSVACTDDISLLKLSGPGVGLKPGILARVTGILNEKGINIKSVITSQISINLILEKNTGERALELITKLGFSAVQEISLLKDVSLIGIIGHGMQTNYGVSARIFNAVAEHKINVLLSGSGASDLVSYLVVKQSDKQKSVREIYNAFFNQQ